MAKKTTKKKITKKKVTKKNTKKFHWADIKNQHCGCSVNANLGYVKSSTGAIVAKVFDYGNGVISSYIWNDGTPGYQALTDYMSMGAAKAAVEKYIDMYCKEFLEDTYV